MTKLHTSQKLDNTVQLNLTKVFISYSHDTNVHSNKVLSLSNRLREQGIDCSIDQYEESPPEGWPRWMDKQINSSNYTIIICTKGYYDKLKSLDKVEFGKGVKWESLLLYSQLYHNGSMNLNFIPVLFDSDSIQYIPEPLRDSTHYIMDKDFEKLTNRLKGKSNTSKPKLGSKLRESSLEDKKIMKPSKFPIYIEVDGSIEDYTQDQKTALVNAISEFLKADYSIKIDKIEKGSVRLYIKLSKSDITKLTEGVKSGVFDSHGVRKIKILNLFLKNESSAKDDYASKKLITNTYETVFIINPVLTENEMKETVDKFKMHLSEQGAKVVNEENWGLKKLAYPIQNKTTGYYYLLGFGGNSTIVNELEIRYRRDERIMRFLTVKLDKHSEKYTDMKRKNALLKNKMI